MSTEKKGAPSLMDTLGVSEEETKKGQGGRWRGKRWDTQSEAQEKEWKELMKALGIPTNKGYQYENKKYGEVMNGLAASLNSGEVKIVKA